MAALAAARFRVSIVAPLGADARNTSEVLQGAGLTTSVFRTLGEAAEHFGDDCGALLVTEEALRPADREILALALARQPRWSDLPVVLITTARRERHGLDARVVAGPRGNVTLIERPLRVSTLVATVDAALRARQRQYEVRDLLRERETLLSSLEERVTERTAKLQTMVTEMESFSYSVSHDLRSPLRVLAGYAQAVWEDHAAEISPEARRYLEKIRNAAERMDRLTQDLLAYTRVASGDLPMAAVDLDEVLRDVIETYPALREARAHIRVRGPLGRVHGHAPSLMQGFSNLLENAVKFALPGQPPRVEVYTERHGGWLRCTVRDRGQGIDLAHQERIFGMFERAADKSTPGTGIGLAIVKKAAERMGGSVGVHSVVGEGTRFWLDLKPAAP